VGLFDYINSINDKKYSPPNDIDKDYNIFMVNRFFMHFPDTVFIANELNSREMSNKMHYDFLYHVVSKKKRFTKWYKETNSKNLDLVRQYYECNEEKAKQYLSVLNNDDLENMNKEMTKGKINE